jgi:hypothetical protein
MEYSLNESELKEFLKFNDTDRDINPAPRESPRFRHGEV